MRIDRRCPRCDRPVKGREEVVDVKRPGKEAEKCQHCGLPVISVRGVDDLGPFIFYAGPGTYGNEQGPVKADFVHPLNRHRM